jgi:hypothetical protein
LRLKYTQYRVPKEYDTGHTPETVQGFGEEKSLEPLKNSTTPWLINSHFWVINEYVVFAGQYLRTPCWFPLLG